MAYISVVRDPQIKLSPIIHTLRQPSEEEIGEAPGNPTEIQQTKVFGLICPILALNGVAVDFQDVRSFELDCTGTVPRIKFEFRDRDNLLNNYNNPGNDNELRVEILHPMDDTYKKINMSLICTDITINDGIVKGEAELLVPEFTKARFKALGQISTYDLFDKISVETGLGFATNSEATEDTRFIQCQYQSYKDLIDNEIEKSGSSDVHVYDWWIDMWNNLVLCDLYDRVNSEDTEEDMTIWVTVNNQAVSVNDSADAVQTTAIFSNHPMYENTDLHVIDYDVQNAPASQSRGNSVALSVYEEDKKESVDHYIADGDIQKNEFVRFEYAGEVYGGYNYLLAEKARDIYLKKIKSEVIVIHTSKPQLGIMRGDQLRFVWYDSDSGHAMMQDNLERAGAIQTSEQLSSILGWVKDWDVKKDVADNPVRINMQYSGQYTCIGQYIRYSIENNKWDCWLYLTRPASKRPQIVNDLNEEQ